MIESHREKGWQPYDGYDDYGNKCLPAQKRKAREGTSAAYKYDPYSRCSVHRRNNSGRKLSNTSVGSESQDSREHESKLSQDFKDPWNHRKPGALQNCCQNTDQDPVETIIEVSGKNGNMPYQRVGQNSGWIEISVEAIGLAPPPHAQRGSSDSNSQDAWDRSPGVRRAPSM